MDTQKYNLNTLKQNITDNNLRVKAVIQDILAFRGTLNELQILNEIGRKLISELRKAIGALSEWAQDENDPEILKELEQHREQFSRTLQAFRRANISTMLEIEKFEKEELFTNTGILDLGMRGTTKHSRSSLISQQDSVTDRMLSISRHLSETTQKSAVTLESLVASSVNVEGTRDELHNTAGAITQSGKYLKKYGRRDFTDKFLLFFAFTFFLSCVVYILQKRMF